MKRPNEGNERQARWCKDEMNDTTEWSEMRAARLQRRQRAGGSRLEEEGNRREREKGKGNEAALYEEQLVRSCFQ